MFTFVVARPVWSVELFPQGGKLVFAFVRRRVISSLRKTCIYICVSPLGTSLRI